MELYWGEGIKVNKINLINGEQTGVMDNKMLFTSVNTSPIYSNIRQTRAVLPTHNESTNMPSPKKTYTLTKSQDIDVMDMEGSL